MMTDKDCEQLQKQVDFLKSKCRQAGGKIKQLEERIKDMREISAGHRKIVGDLHKELEESKNKQCKCGTKT
jgi:DNA repair exonuclease SbcCD ATPase subunit